MNLQPANRNWARVFVFSCVVTVFGAMRASAAQPLRAGAAATRGNPRPNILFILADDLGYGDLGCYGQTRIKTPNLDRLAESGMRFTSFYAGSTVCAPSRAALMTGQHSGHNVIRGNQANVALRPQDRTVAELLKQAGYSTALIGKWGLGEEGSTGVPGLKGLDEFLGYLNQTHAHDYYPDHLFRSSGTLGVTRVDLEQNRDGRRGQYADDLFTAEALKFIERFNPGRNEAVSPFFLYLAYTIPHANNEEGTRTGNGMQVPSDSPYSAESWPQVQKNKAAMITRLDHDIGKILALLKQLGLEENTVVFFSSDNGPHKEGGVDPAFFKSSGPFRGIKRDLYEGGIRVPLIVRWPGKIHPGSTNQEPYSFWDFLPTAAELTSSKPPADLDGLSILPALLGRSMLPHHQFLYWEFHERGFQQAVRMGDWKAIRLQSGQPLELYNLKVDPGETENVAGKKPEIIDKIEEYLKTARTEDPAWPTEPRKNLVNQ